MQKLNLTTRLFLWLAPVVFIGWCFFAMQGCKNPQIENVNLLRASDSLNLAKDSIPITVITQIQAPQVSSGISQGVLGSMYDRNFGTMYCGFYGQLPLTTAGVVIPPGAVLDSVILTLAYNGQLGLCHKPVDIAVYQVTDSLSVYLNYYTNSTFHVNNPPIGVVNNFVPDMLDSTYIASTGVYEAPNLRVPLANNFGSRILLDSAGLQNDSLFLVHFKGLYVTATSGATGDGMMYMNLTSALSGVNFYYHYVLDGIVYPGDLLFTFAGVAVNHYDCIGTNTPVAAAIHSGASAQKVYLEAGSGTEAKITFSIDTLLKLGKIGINEAEIVFSQSPTDTQFTAPITVNLLRIDDAGTGQVLDDAGYTTFGGVLTYETVTPTLNIYRYRFNISRYFQKLVQGVYNNNGLYLQIQSGSQVADRVVLTNTTNPNTPNSKNYKIALAVTYTRLQ